MCSGRAQDVLRHAQECSPSAQVKAAAAHVQTLKQNQRKKKLSLTYVVVEASVVVSDVIVGAVYVAEIVKTMVLFYFLASVFKFRKKLHALDMVLQLRGRKRNSLCLRRLGIEDWQFLSPGMHQSSGRCDDRVDLPLEDNCRHYRPLLVQIHLA
jgi:hypothetical protein